MASPFAAQPLPTRAVISLTGDAPLAFLHNLLTCDVAALPDRVWAYGALLSPQGKIQHDVFVIRDGETVFVDCAATQRRNLLQKLMLYRLRAKIEIAMDDKHAVAVGTRDGIVAPDPRLEAMGTRAIIPAGSIAAGKGYDAVRIIHGLADSTEDIGENVLFPHEANLDQLKGVSFSKGCYVGQEVVSRMQHRGTARSRILPVSATAPLPAKGTEIRAGDILAGEMLSSAGSTGLALLRLDRLAEAKEPLLTGSATLKVHKPQWMTVPIPVTNPA